MREIRVADATGSEPLPLSEYREVIVDLRTGFLSAPSEEVVRRHLADMFVVCEATRHLSRDSRRRRRTIVVGSTLGLGAVLAVGSAAAATGNLPTPAQEMISRVAAPIGLDLPAGNSKEAPGRGGDNPGQADSAPGQQSDPGNSENAPGLGGVNPGRSDSPPGSADNAGNAPTTLPPQAHQGSDDVVNSPKESSPLETLDHATDGSGNARSGSGSTVSTHEGGSVGQGSPDNGPRK
jgi:hypothetical protein